MVVSKLLKLVNRVRVAESRLSPRISLEKQPVKMPVVRSVMRMGSTPLFCNVAGVKLTLS